MLAVHGVQDNAATFDKLVPLLEVKSVLAVDVPGHGFSSHIPRSFLYSFTDAVCFLRFVIKHHFQWKQPVELLGHSFGSGLCFVYAALYPDQVSKYISIDCGRHQTTILPNAVVNLYKTAVEKTMIYEENKYPPQYNYKDLVELSLKAREYRLSKESCEILLSRGITELENGKVCVSRDIRTKLKDCGRFTPDELVDFASKIKCDVLSIQADKGIVKNDVKGDTYRKTVEIMITNSPKNKHIMLPGYHHIHLDNPELVANVINSFLSK